VGRVRTRALTVAAPVLTALATLTALLPAALPATLAAPGASADAATPVRQVATRHWDSTAELRTGSVRGVTVTNGVLGFGRRAGVSGGYDYATWTSPWVRPGFTLTEIVPSWTAATPGDSWIEVELRGRTSTRTATWDTISLWALDDTGKRRTSGSSQTDDLGRVSYDTWITGGVPQYQVRVTLHRRTGTTARPVVRAVHTMASRIPSTTGVTTSRPGAVGGAALGKVLNVPRYSQMVHKGSYPQYDGGGEAWCSPTSTTMLLAYYKALPPAKEYAWVRWNYTDRVVAHHARMTYDTSFGGTGNWPFNTAYAGSRTGRAFVTRLTNLRQAEQFIAAGIPLAASVTFGRGKLSGAPISATNGHLMVIVGFTKSGDVVVNDPAAGTRSGVRRTYDRGQFEDAWLSRYRSGSSLRGSGGLVYVVHDAKHPLPTRWGARGW
jgi:hypothetical protein